MSTPKVRVGRRGSANISREYGSALDSNATAQPAGRSAGESSAAPACAMPMGTMTSAPTSVPSAAVPSAVHRSGLPAEYDVEGPAQLRRRARSRCPPARQRLRADAQRQQRHQPRRRQRDPQEIQRPMRCRHGDRQGTREFQRHRDAERYPLERQIEEQVHPSHRESVDHDAARLAGAWGASARGARRPAACSSRARDAAPSRPQAPITGNSPLTSAAPS